MDRLPGLVDLSFAADDTEREHLVDEYLGLLARIYPDPTRRGGGRRLPRSPSTPPPPASRSCGGWRSGTTGRWRAFRATRSRCSSGVGWWTTSRSTGSKPARYITYDSFQLVFEDGRITGLLDFEHAHVGDPMMDLATLRIRDTLKNLGDLAETGTRYEATTGVVIDHDVVDYHTVLYNALSVISVGPPLADPLRGTDWLSYTAWYVNGARWAFEVIAEMRGYELRAGHHPRPPTEPPCARVPASRGEPPGRGIVGLPRRLRAHRARPGSRTTCGGSTRSGRRWMRPTSTTSRRVLGHRPDPAEADAELVDFVDHAGPEHEEALVRLLDAWAQRVHLGMASPHSLMLRHPPLRSLRPDRASQRVAEETWPAGAIPGTR